MYSASSTLLCKRGSVQALGQRVWRCALCWGPRTQEDKKWGKKNINVFFGLRAGRAFARAGAADSSFLRGVVAHLGPSWHIPC
jgi:hypothetical protein